MNWSKWKPYIFWIAVSEGVGALSGFLSRNGMQLYSTAINKPPLSPPGWLFPVVWSILYVLMGISSYLITESGKPARSKTALTVYGVQLFFNFMWSIIFFNFEAYLFAFIWLIALVAGVISIVVRIFKAFFSLLSIKKEYGLTTDTKSAPWLPVVVGLAVFFIGLGVSSVVSGINTGDLFADLKESDFSNEEEASILADIRNDVLSNNFSYLIEDDTDVLVSIGFNAATRIYTFTVSEYGAGLIGVTAGTYEGEQNNDGSISYDIDSTIAAVLHKFTLFKLVNLDEMAADLDNLAIKESGIEYKCYYHKETPSGDAYTYFRVCPITVTSSILDMDTVEGLMGVKVVGVDGDLVLAFTS